MYLVWRLIKNWQKHSIDQRECKLELTRFIASKMFKGSVVEATPLRQDES
jgi:hypothetical protein